MFLRRLKKNKITAEQVEILDKAKEQQIQAEEILQEVRNHALFLRARKERNHFAEGLSRALGGI
jgi:hypothetical protein